VASEVGVNVLGTADFSSDNFVITSSLVYSNLMLMVFDVVNSSRFRLVTVVEVLYVVIGVGFNPN